MAMAQVRNFVAKALWAPKYRPQKIKSVKVYSRKIKHKGKPNDSV